MWLECWTCVHLLVNVLCFIILLELNVNLLFMKQFSLRVVEANYVYRM